MRPTRIPLVLVLLALLTLPITPLPAADSPEKPAAADVPLVAERAATDAAAGLSRGH